MKEKKSCAEGPKEFVPYSRVKKMAVPEECLVENSFFFSLLLWSLFFTLFVPLGSHITCTG